MGLLQLISRQVGAADRAWGVESFSWTDENGISRTMSQVSASDIPMGDGSGSVEVKWLTAQDPGHKHSKLWSSDGGVEMIVVDIAGNVSIGLIDPSVGYSVEHYCDGVAAYKVRSALVDYSQFGFGVDVLSGYTFIQSNKSGVGTQLPIAFWINSGAGAIRAWDISIDGHLLAGGTGLTTQNITTAGTIHGAIVTGTSATVTTLVATGKTTSVTMAVTGLVAYPNNDAALAAGLVAGDFYRNAANTDCVCVVH